MGCPVALLASSLKKNREMPALRDDLLKAHAGNVNISQVSAHVCVTFIGAHYKLTGFRHGKIDASKCSSPGKEFFHEDALLLHAPKTVDHYFPFPFEDAHEKYR